MHTDQVPSATRRMKTMKTLTIRSGSEGNCRVQPDASSIEALPSARFSRSETRLLGVRLNGGEEHTGIFLLSASDATKAADVETVGGFSSAAFGANCSLLATREIEIENHANGHERS
jgi:hypothetical protein